MRKIVITGGTYAGKTSLVELFKKDKFKVIPDIGLKIIQELNSKLGKEKQKQFRANHPLNFYSMIIKRQLALEKKLNSKIVILDRGVHDYIAMLELTGTKVPVSLMRLVKNISYDLVFICDTLSKFNERKSSGRSLTKNDSLKLNKLIKKIYQNKSNKVIRVKEMPLEKRYRFVRKNT